MYASLVASARPVPSSPADILDSCSLMNPLSDAERSALLDDSFYAYAERGEPLWIAGTPARFLAVVDEGLLRMTRRSPGQVEIAVEIVGPGGCAGLLACVAGCVYPLSAIAVTDVSYLKIPNDRLMGIYETNAELKDQFVRALAPALLDSFDLMASMLSGNVEQRMAVALCRVSELLSGKDFQAPLPITRQNLADIASTTVESAIRVTSRWQKEGWISTRPRELKIIDLTALRRIVRS